MIRKDSAVSPVIGVLLMLVVTLIIAAIVSGFAGGLAGSQEKAPQASIEVKTGYAYNTAGTAIDPAKYDISFTHKGGDSIPTKDVTMITYLTLPNGTQTLHKQTKNSVTTRYGGGTSTSPSLTYARVPFIYDPTKYEKKGLYQTESDIENGISSPSWWGLSTFSPGQVMRTYNLNSTAYILGLVSDSDAYPDGTTEESISLLKQCIQNQSPVRIQWIHNPSQKVIFEKTITLGR